MQPPPSRGNAQTYRDIPLRGRIVYVAGLQWHRGRARVDHGHVELVEPTAYDPETTRDVLYDLIAIRDRASIVDFVARHGLLTTTEGREPLGDWYNARDALGAALAIIRPDLPLGISVMPTKGKRRGGWVTVDPDDDLAARVVTEGLAQHVEYRVVVPQNLPFGTLPPGVRYGPLWVPRTLLGCAYIELLDVMLGGLREGRTCRGCGRPFLAADKRRLYHSDACGNAARARVCRARRRGS